QLHSRHGTRSTGPGLTTRANRQIDHDPIRALARHLSFTPLIETLRGLLTGPPSAGPILMAIAGCAGLSLLGYLWVRAQFTNRA
ncbi:hypothetical protein AB0J22_49145, partial [Nonomuraea dietziae]